MLDYSKGKIYKIFNSIDDEIYVGATIEKLSKRMAHHRGCVNMDKCNGKLYQHMRSLGVDKLYIELVEIFPCETIEELLAKDGEWITKIGTLNMKVSGRTKQETDKKYYNKNRATIDEQQKRYYENNKEMIKQKVKEYREVNLDIVKAKQAENITCERGCKITRSHISYHRKSPKHNELLKDKERIEKK